MCLSVSVSLCVWFSIERRCNVLLQGQYWTIHITPEPEFAYVSFETNVPMSDYRELFQRVVRVFRPGSTSLTIFANSVSYTSVKASN